MIDPQFILEWKQIHGDVYTTSINGIEYYFRALTFREHDNLADTVESMADAEEVIIETAILWPAVDFAKVKAGIITSLAEEILEVSGFSDIDNARRILEEKREESRSFRFNMKAFVLAVRTQFIEEDLDNMSFSQLAKEVAMAERIMAIQQAVMGMHETGVQLEIVNPEEIKEADKQSQDFSNIPIDPEANIDKPTTLGTAKIGDPIAQRLYQALN